MDLWYNKPSVLINIDNNQSNNLMRLSIFIILLINFTNISNKYLSFAIILIILSLIIKPIEKLENTHKYNNCRKPTKNNPFMNFTVGEYIKNPTAKPACLIDKEIRKEMRNKFLDGKKDYNVTDFFNRNHSDLAFYTMPVTTAVNDLKGLGKKLYGKMGLCKSYGINCLKNRDNKYHHSRTYYWY